MTVAGISSPLHVWDITLEAFVLRDIHSEQRGVLMIDGMDEVVSQRSVIRYFVGQGSSLDVSLIQRFLTIGALTRRLEILIEALRERFVPP